MLDERFYVYVLLDPRKPGKFKYEGLDHVFASEPFYVGKGQGDRVELHYSRKLKANPHKTRKIRKLSDLGFSPLYIKIFETSDELLALDFEKTAINAIGRTLKKCGPLTNIKDGGTCAAGGGWKLSVETVAAMSLSRMGRTLSEETKAKISSAQIGMQKGDKHPQWNTHRSQETKSKISKSMQGKQNHFSGKKHSDESRLKMSIAIKAGKARSRLLKEQGSMTDVT